MTAPVVAPVVAAAAAPAAPAAPVPGTPAHDAAMVAKVEARMEPKAPAAAVETPTPAADRPAWLPEKYKTPEEFAAAHKALEAKLGAPKVEAPAAAAPAALAVTPPVAGDAAAAATAVKAAGLDMAAINAEFAEKLDLTPETRAKLDAAGYSKEMVDGYIAGQRAIGEQYAAKAHAAAGSAEAYGKMSVWAGANMNAAEIAAYNEAATSGDVAKMTLAVSGLRSRYEAAVGSSPKLVSGSAVAAGDGVYASKEEMKAAMRDPRYKADPAYRKTVEDKVGRTDW